MNKHNTGLILVDVQGKLAEQMVDYQGLFERLRVLIAGAQLMDIPIVWMEQLPAKLGATRDEIIDLLPGQALEKNTFSGLKNEKIVQTIQSHKRSSWLVAGIEAHICVYQTVSDLLSQKYDVQLVTDAVSSRSEENRALAIAKMQSLGASLTSVEMALFELQEIAEGDVFPELIRLVK
ncbi:isochorismatase family protein [Bacterioplanoides sp. SCSIO 12839]|uniref:isochorismatase family protein n=1 Tax=Bacterioplanoides sp. SCSIO 12839 TaxID=2829569 RepID=UPI00210757CA|nr:isochorismatase family protein [Bacterioplanoides sp. SCSIO 12839]UTW47365.1 isochorismatase family protein [Bacterioplanoides sp. SCSIO 12839]